MVNRRTSGGYSRSSYSRGRVGARSLRRRGAGAFLRRYAKVIAVAAILIIAAVICIVLFAGGGNEAVAQVSPQALPSAGESATPVPTIDLSGFDEQYNYESAGDDVLAGLEGAGDSMSVDEESDLQITSGIKIGITIGGISGEHDKLLLSKLEEASGDAVKKGLVFQVYCYDAQGDYNQQLQDMRSLIKNEVDVIIAGATDAEGFKMVSFMAEQEGIPLVAYDAPVDTGFAANVVSNQKAWGERFGQFVAGKLAAGSVVQVLGSEANGVDAVRKAQIDGILKSNINLSVTTSYANWDSDKAKDAIAGLLEDEIKIDAVIAAEGMAEGALDAFIEAGELPQVMCGDMTAGFIKKWYALKYGGLVIVPPAQGKKSPPPAEVFAAGPGEFAVCAQPAPARASAIAFEIALKLAEGRTLITQGTVYEYTAVTFITDENLSHYYEMVKDMPDSFAIGDPVDSDVAESLFNPAQ